MRCSLFHKNSARSATWKCEQQTHFARIENSRWPTLAICSASTSSNTSSISFNMITDDTGPAHVSIRQAGHRNKKERPTRTLLPRRGPRPVPEDAVADSDGRLRVFLHVLRDAVGQLLVVKAHALGAVQRDERTAQEDDVLLLQGQRESVDDGAQDLQQLPDTVVALRLVDKAVESVADSAADETTMGHELACASNLVSHTARARTPHTASPRTVNAVQNRLQVVALTRILTIEEVDELQAELLREVPLGNLALHLAADHETQQKLVHHLQVGPRGLQHWLILLGVVVLRLHQNTTRVRAECSNSYMPQPWPHTCGGNARNKFVDTIAMTSGITFSVKICQGHTTHGIQATSTTPHATLPPLRTF